MPPPKSRSSKSRTIAARSAAARRADLAPGPDRLRRHRQGEIRLRRLPDCAAPSGRVAGARSGRCAGDQGKYWQMHDSLFTNAPAREAAQFTAQAKALGLDEAKFGGCLNGGVHAAAIRASVERMQQLGVGGTPLTLIGLTRAGCANESRELDLRRPALRRLQDGASTPRSRKPPASPMGRRAKASAAGAFRARTATTRSGRRTSLPSVQESCAAVRTRVRRP